MPHAVRKRLLAEYAMALVVERELWRRLREPQLTEAQRCQVFAEWKQASMLLKSLARQLRDAGPASDSVSEGAPPAELSGRCGTALPDSADEHDAITASPSPRAEIVAAAWRRAFNVLPLAASLRIVSAWGARLGAAIPRPGSL